MILTIKKIVHHLEGKPSKFADCSEATNNEWLSGRRLCLQICSQSTHVGPAHEQQQWCQSGRFWAARILHWNSKIQKLTYPLWSHLLVAVHVWVPSGRKSHQLTNIITARSVLGSRGYKSSVCNQTRKLRLFGIKKIINFYQSASDQKNVEAGDRFFISVKIGQIVQYKQPWFVMNIFMLCSESFVWGGATKNWSENGCCWFHAEWFRT